MVPQSFATFFLVTAGTGGTFIGLLFIAISILPRRTFGNPAFAGPQHQYLAEATLFTLFNGFAVSSFALIPGFNVGSIALVLGACGVLAGSRLSQCLVQLHHHGSSGLGFRLHILRVVSLSLVATVVYAIQCLLGLHLLVYPMDARPFLWLAPLIIGLYGLAVVRAWTLLGDPRHGWSGWLNPLEDLAPHTQVFAPGRSFVSVAGPCASGGRASAIISRKPVSGRAFHRARACPGERGMM